jgi:hypothetical protein
MLDMQGKELRSGTLHFECGKTMLDIRDLPAGIYMIIAGEQKLRFIKEQ